MHLAQIGLNQLGKARRLPQMLVELEVLHDEVDPADGLRLLRCALEADRVVLHPRHPGGVFRLCLGEEVGLEAAGVREVLPAGERVDVQAREEVALLGAVAPAVTQRDERVGRSSHAHADAPSAKLVPEQQGHLERDVLLSQPAGEEHARIPRVRPPVPGVHGHHMTGPQPVGEPSGGGAGCEQPPALLNQPRRALVVVVTLRQERRQNLGDELERQVHGVTDHDDRSGESLEPVIEEIQGRPDQKPEPLLGHRDVGPGVAELDRAAQRTHQLRRRDERCSAPVGPDGDALVAARSAHHDRPRSVPRGQRGEKRQRRDHRRPLTDTARAVSRSTIRRLSVSRLSCCFLPLPSASATFACPLLK